MSSVKVTVQFVGYLIFRRRERPGRLVGSPVLTAWVPRCEDDLAATETNFAERGRCLTKSATGRGQAGGPKNDAESVEPSIP